MRSGVYFGVSLPRGKTIWPERPQLEAAARGIAHSMCRRGGDFERRIPEVHVVALDCWFEGLNPWFLQRVNGTHPLGGKLIISIQ